MPFFIVNYIPDNVNAYGLCNETKLTVANGLSQMFHRTVFLSLEKVFKENKR